MVAVSPFTLGIRDERGRMREGRRVNGGSMIAKERRCGTKTSGERHGERFESTVQ